MTLHDHATDPMKATHYTEDFATPTQCKNVDSALEDVDSLVQQTFEHMRLLREHQNTLIPVARLPFEVLSSAFRICAPTPASRASDGPLLAFSQVCRRWRTVALQDPCIWAAPLCSRPDLGEMMLTRAKTFPLDIDADCASESNACAYRLVHRAVSEHCHFRRMKLVAHPVQALQLLEPVLDTMPYLTDFEVTTTHSAPLPIAHISAPKLRRFRLHRCSIPSNSQLLFNLTTLELSYYPGLAVQMDFADVIAVVKQNPGLERFVFESADIAPQTEVPSTPPDGKINLPCLESLVLQDLASRMRIFFQHFTFPSLKHLQLSNHDEERSIAEVRQLLDQLKQWLESDSCLGNILVLVVRSEILDTIDFEAYCERPHFRFGEVHVKLGVDWDIAVEALKYLSRLFQLDELVVAKVASMSVPRPRGDPLVCALADLPRLNQLDLHGGCALNWLTYLENVKGDDGHLQFVSLKTLRLSPDIRSLNAGTTFANRLAHMLQRFIDAGRPIPNVHLLAFEDVLKPSAHTILTELKVNIEVIPISPLRTPAESDDGNPN